MGTFPFCEGQDPQTECRKKKKGFLSQGVRDEEKGTRKSKKKCNLREGMKEYMYVLH